MGNCVASPAPAPAPSSNPSASAPVRAPAAAPVTTTSSSDSNSNSNSRSPSLSPGIPMSTSGKAKIYVVYYSMYGHLAQLAEQVAAGVTEAGAEAKIFRIAETLPKEILDLMHAPPKNESHPVIKPDDLKAADGVIFGIPTRFGSAAAQVKAFWDATGQLWQSGALAGKTAGVFFSTGTQGGGQETTALTHLTHFVHHGMIYIPIGYTSPLLFNMDEVHGGSPYGAGTLAGPTGARQPSKLEKDVAHHQGKHHATITIALKTGREAHAK